jgi:hypothetical protein
MDAMNAERDVPFQHVGVHQRDMGGWLRVFVDADALGAAQLPIYLSYGVTQWFRARPHYHLRCVTPIIQDGSVVEPHAWYDQHLFAETSGLQSDPVVRDSN